jgi:peptide/nickel transport system ATP-binding protein
VTIQAQVLSLMADLKQDRQMSMIFITHNMGVVASIADRVAVMYAGHIVEMADVQEVFQHPVHPYTEALLKSIPRLDRRTQEIRPIPGQVPPIDRMPPGCRYASRCDVKVPICGEKNPELVTLDQDANHFVRCWVRGAGRNGGTHE